jgi:transposase-like protein
MPDLADTLTTGAVARQLGVRASTLRRWEAAGLIPHARGQRGGRPGRRCTPPRKGGPMHNRPTTPGHAQISRHRAELLEILAALEEFLAQCRGAAPHDANTPNIEAP